MDTRRTFCGTVSSQVTPERATGLCTQSVAAVGASTYSCSHWQLGAQASRRLCDRELALAEQGLVCCAGLQAKPSARGGVSARALTSTRVAIR